MAFSNQGTDVPIKHESSYNGEAISNQVLVSPESPSLKRRRSDKSQDLGEKRQRVDSGSSSNAYTEAFPSAEFADMLAQATSTVMQQHAPYGNGLHISEEQAAPSAAFVGQKERNRHEGHSSGFTSDPHLYMRILSLPILESLSTQILSTLAQGPWYQTIKVVQSPESELGQAYATLKSLFDQTRKIYSQRAQFLSAKELNIQESEHRATIRITNLATFVSAVFGGGTIGFYELNDHFIETFTPDGTPMSKEAGDLFLSLKTQMFLSAVTQEEQERTKEDILEDFFPAVLGDLLQSRHPATPLADSEREFLEASQNRRDFLMREANDLDSIQAISTQYAWEAFLESLSSHLSKTYEPLLTPYMKRHALTAPTSPIRGPSHHAYQTTDNATLSFAQEVELAAQAALKVAFEPIPANNQSQQNEGPSQIQYPELPQHKMIQNSAGRNVTYPGNPPHQRQSAPTYVLYERARLAAASKANTGNARRPGLPSQRRPWTPEEEASLMAGLDQVKGPHWSQILALYGPGGSINETLKDRNQVQLKDKARNLKLFFLKSSCEVPYYLQTVTGELKTRAPSQAARKEAEARQKLASSEEKDRINGILTLANGLQDHSPGSSTHSQSPPGDHSPLHVVEPASQSRTPTPPHQTADEHLAQSLMASNANSGAHRSGGNLVGTARMV